MTHRPARLLAVATALAVVGLSAGCGADEAGHDPGSGQASEAAAEGVVWIASEGSDALTLLDARTGEVLTTLAGIAAPHNVQATPDGSAAWATSSGGVVQVDAATLEVVGAAPSGAHPAHVVAGPEDSVWVTASEDGVLVEHTGDLAEQTSHRLGGAPHGMRMAHDGSFAAVANTGRGTVDLVDLDAGAAVRSVRVGPSPVQTAVSADDSEVFVSVAGSNEVVRIDVASGEVTGRVEVPSAPAQVWITSDGLLLSANQGTEEDPGETVSLIDTDTMEVVADVTTAPGPHGIVVDEAEQRAWVTNTYDDSVTLVDLDEREAVATVKVGHRPNGITLTSTTPASYPDPVVMLELPDGISDGGGHDHGSEGHSH